VPGLAQGASAQRIERLGGGTVNEVYRVDTAAGRFVLRLDGAAWRRPGVDRARELLLHRAAAAGGLAPALLEAAPEAQGLLIMPYLEGRVWSAADYARRDALWRLGERLYVLHRLAVPAVGVFDPWQVASAYVRQIDSRPHATAMPADARTATLQRLQDACSELRLDAAANSVVHGDLWQGNLLEGAGLWLLDWEYAQVSDPLMDVACVLAYYPAAERYRDELAAAAGIGTRARGEALAVRVFICRALAWLWHLARGEEAAPP
jgi:aminoglycoside phosphotransferase (APT) family kinase protein